MATKTVFTKIEGRKRGYRGDRESWVKIDTDTETGAQTITVQRANRGKLSYSYEAGLQSYCETIGIDFSNVRPGERKSVTIEV